MPDSQCVQDFLGVGENLISIGLDLFLENIVWESSTTLSVYIGNHLRLYHGVSGSALTNSDVVFLLDLVEMKNYVGRLRPQNRSKLLNL